MSILDDVDADALISRLSGPLSPLDREAFRRAAEAALSEAPCIGPGLAYRTLAALQREYFHPPDIPRNAPRWERAPRFEHVSKRAR